MALAKIVHPSSKITRKFHSLNLPKIKFLSLYDVIFFANIYCWQTNNFPQDGLTATPDEILEFILSLLTLKEMQRTSVLSRRWRDLWTFVTHNLVFDHPNLLSLRKKMTNLNFMVRTEFGLVKILSFGRIDSNLSLNIIINLSEITHKHRKLTEHNKAQKIPTSIHDMAYDSKKINKKW